MEREMCPICGGSNQCASGNMKDAGACWCTDKKFSEEVFRQIPEEELHKRCICPNCLARITAGK